jgi:hypothetical protein
MTNITRIPVERDYKVTTLELFFDLVFVFAITQLTGLLAGEMTRGGAEHLLIGLCQVLLAFGVLWWIYGGYTWLTNNHPAVHIRPAHGRARSDRPSPDHRYRATGGTPQPGRYPWQVSVRQRPGRIGP